MTHPAPDPTLPPLQRLIEIMARLRAPDGCPWDREQSHLTLRPYLIEECYEAIDAIDADDMHSLREELGDVLLQVVFHSQLATERSDFSIHDVATAISDKLVRRHPHVFGEVTVSGADEVVTNWEQIKLAERQAKQKQEAPPSALDGVPKALPALLQAVRLQDKAARHGFDWPDDGGVLDKLAEELTELREAKASQDKAHIEEEFGDVLFLLSNLARHWKLDPEQALRGACQKFNRRYRRMEQLAAAAGSSISPAMSLEQMDLFWDQAKAEERAGG